MVGVLRVLQGGYGKGRVRGNSVGRELLTAFGISILLFDGKTIGIVRYVVVVAAHVVSQLRICSVPASKCVSKTTNKYPNPLI